MSAALARKLDHNDPHTPTTPDNGAHSPPATGATLLRFHPQGPAAAHLRRHQLQDAAFTLACKGCRSPEIARRLHVSERTTRAWLQQMRQEIAAEHPAFDRAGQLLLAVEGLREVLQAAWQAFEEDRSAQEALLAGTLDYLRKRVVTSDRSDPTGNTQRITEDYARPRFTSHAPTHLRLALKTQVEIARLLGLYDRGVRDQPAAPPNHTLATDAIPVFRDNGCRDLVGVGVATRALYRIQDMTARIEQLKLVHQRSIDKHSGRITRGNQDERAVCGERRRGGRIERRTGLRNVF
jgi:DNA-binding CsgD family transcriptional regulator